jgi:K+ transporter
MFAFNLMLQEGGVVLVVLAKLIRLRIFQHVNNNQYLVSIANKKSIDAKLQRASKQEMQQVNNCNIY